MEHKNFEKKKINGVFTAPDAHMHTSLSYTCISIQPADKAVECLIKSCD